MTLIISGTITGGDDLDSAGQNPATIVANAYVSDLFSGGSALIGGSAVALWSITNFGLVAGYDLGIWLQSAGTIINKAIGTIDGGDGGIDVAGTGAVVNAGYIGTPDGVAVELDGGGRVTDQSTGTITANLLGVGIYGGAGSVTNAGLISGVYSEAIALYTGGGVSNLSTGTITGKVWGVYVTGGTGAVTNAGVIRGTSEYGVQLLRGGGVTNLSTGTIAGANNGIKIDLVAGSVTNAGYILGTAEYGVVMTQGGVVTNAAGGTITSEGAGLDVSSASASVTNFGVISGVGGAADDLAGSFGMVLSAGSEVVNDSTGTISGGDIGLFINKPGTIYNAGFIVGHSDYGVQLGGGFVRNDTAGVISGGIDAVYINGTGAGTVINAGLIDGQKFGVLLYAGPAGTGVVENEGTGTIFASTAGVFIDETGASLTNAGTIFGFTYGVRLAGGTVVNQSSGTIGTDTIVETSYVATGGVHIDSGAGTVVNAGLIQGVVYAVQLGAGFTNRVVDDPGAVFVGRVDGGAAVGGAVTETLELAAAATAGQISGLGSQFINFENTVIDGGAQWTLTGTNTQAAGTTLINFGALTIADGGLSDAGGVVNNGVIQDTGTLSVVSLTGDGEVQIGDDGTLTVTGTVAATETIAFGGTGLLALAPASFAGQIDGLGGGGRIALSGVTDATSAGVVNGDTLAIQQSAGPTIDLMLDPTQSYAGVVFPIATLGGVQFIDASDQVGPTVISQGETESVTGAAGATLAAISGGTGGITVTGANSLLTTTANAFIVGDTGLGGLSIESGGAVSALAGMVIANTAPASGSSVNLSGAGSGLQVAGTLVVGEAGSGALSLSQGASASVGALDLGAAATGDGDVSLAGAGTTLTVTGALTLGAAAAGELSVLGGAALTIGGGVVGSSKTASGNLDVEGAGSLLTINGGTLTVGANGPAEFTLGIGATLSGEVANGQFGVVSEYGNVDPATDPNDGTQNVGFGNSLIYDYYVANSGTIKITSGTATFYTPLVTDETNAADSSTTGLWVIGAHETLVMNATSVDATQVFDLTSASAATLVIGQVPQASTTQTDTFNGQTMPALTGSIAPGAANVLPGWDAPIENFASGDLIVLRGLTYGSATASGDMVTVWSGAPNTSSALGSLTFLTKSGAPSTTQAALAATQINSLACFAEGTRIATADGWVKVENLRVGDRVRTHHGGCEPVVWLGSRAVDCARHPRPETVWPVCVGARAFGDNVPRRELFLSPDHAVFVAGVLVPIRLLVNGSSIVQQKRDRVVYHHVELPEHAVILAEDLPVESYLDTGDRMDFAGGPAIRLFAEFASRAKPDAARIRETAGAAPLVLAGDDLAAARAVVAAAGQWRERWSPLPANGAEASRTVPQDPAEVA